MTEAGLDTVVTHGPEAGAGSLTDAPFWESYWGSFSLPDSVDEQRSFDRALANGLRRLLRGSRGSVLEVGCAPGRWLAWMSKEFGMTVSGIEFTADGASATVRNLQLQGVTPKEIQHADFLAATPAPMFDVVVSFGFVEHFTDLHEVICRHAAWTKPGGRVIIGVPNFRGFHGILQGALDREVLERHNLEIMQPARLRALGAECGLVANSVEYLGSLEPSLPIASPGVRGPSEFLAKVAVRAIWLVRRVPLLGKALDRVNNRFLSAYILASYGKPA